MMVIDGEFNLYLPCLYSDSSQCVMHRDISDGDVRDTGFGVIFSQTSNAYSMSRTTVHIVNIYV